MSAKQANTQNGNKKRQVFGIFAGGAAKSAAFVGAVEEAAKSVEFVGWGGTSAGSIIAALLACGYQPDELREPLLSAPYGEFFRINYWRTLRIAHHRGLVDPKPLASWLRELIHKKFPKLKQVTFKDVEERTGGRHLKIVATNITTQEIKEYSHAKTADAEVAQAVLTSCSFPLLFPPVSAPPNELVDGGVFSNFPMWLFDDEEVHASAFTPVLGFTTFSKPKGGTAAVCEGNAGFFAYASSIFEAILSAQDRVQEKYLDVARLSNVIRIDVSGQDLFPKSNSPDQQQKLLNAGVMAAKDYFEQVGKEYGDPVLAPVSGITREQLQASGPVAAISTIARSYLIHGGIARDNGLSGERKIVRYYINLMAAVTNHDYLDVLAAILAERIRNLKLPGNPKIVGLKKGNSILAYTVAQRLQAPIALFKTDMSYKIGSPFDGSLEEGDDVIIVDDIASDASMLMNAIRNLLLHKVYVKSVVTLIERKEGDARTRIWREKNVPLSAVCKADDDDIHKLIIESKNLPAA